MPPSLQDEPLRHLSTSVYLLARGGSSPSLVTVVHESHSYRYRDQEHTPNGALMIAHPPFHGTHDDRNRKRCQGTPRFAMHWQTRGNVYRE